MMLDCGEFLDITQIQQWQTAALAQLVGITEDLNIDVSALQKIDTAGIQALVAVVQYVEARGHNVVWSELSPAFINAATILGLQNTLRMKPE